jgi:hypothetical protein
MEGTMCEFLQLSILSLHAESGFDTVSLSATVGRSLLAPFSVSDSYSRCAHLSWPRLRRGARKG